MQYDLHCPICRDRISESPVRVSRTLEDLIAEDNNTVGVKDTSVVTYSWAGVNLKGKKKS